MSVTTAVVICAYTEQRWDDIHKAIDSVRKGAVAPDELVLVIDHNPHLLRRARAEFEGLRIIPSVHVKGLSGARNTGLHATSAELIAFLDDDAAARPTWLGELTAPFDDPTVAVVGGRAIPAWASPDTPRMLPPELWWIVGSTYRGMPTELADVRNVMGCTMAFRRSALRGLGGFNTGIGRTAAVPLGCEETELCIRITRSDPRWRIVLNPRSVVDHRVCPERETWRYLIRRSYAEGISKAAISRLVGQRNALQTERAYTRHILPRAVFESVRRFELQPAAGIVSSVMCAAFGYLVGLCRTRAVEAPTLTVCSREDEQAA